MLTPQLCGCSLHCMYPEAEHAGHARTKWISRMPGGPPVGTNLASTDLRRWDKRLTAWTLLGCPES